jgi:DNA-binding transcriptional MerR regulator
MEKNPDAFRTIGEAAEDLDLPQHVLRFWETRFTQIKPLKRGGGRRYYRSGDIDLLRAVKKLLHVDGYTIKGVQRLLKEKGGRALLVAAHGAEGAALESPSIATMPPQPQLPFASGMQGAQSPAAPSRVDAGALQAALSEIAALQEILRSARGV